MDLPGRRFVYYLAMSADGFIARPDGAVDWLEARPAEDYGAAEFFESVDTIVWGRKTFDQYGRPHGLDVFGPGKRHLVLTRAPAQAAPMAGAEFTAEPAEALARRLRDGPGKNVWIMGGADSAAAFLDSGQLDEIVVHVVPVLLRTGIPLLRAGPGDVPLRLRGSAAFADGVVRLHYDVERAERP